MTPSDFEEFSALLSITAEQYGKTMSDGLIKLYWQALAQYDLAAIRAALSAHIRNPDVGQFMPKIADIVRAISGRTEDRALLAWTKVDRAVRTVGSYRDVVFDDPTIHLAIHDMGGWISLCSKTEEEWPFVRNEFVTRYRGYTTTMRAIEQVPALTGAANTHNAARGFQRFIEPPALVGDAAGAQQVLALVSGEKPAALSRVGATALVGGGEA